MIDKKMSEKDYRQAEGLSNSFMIQFDRSPAHAFMVKEPTDAQKFGTMFHSFVLQPEQFKKDYLIIDKVDKRTKEYKSVVEENPDKIIVFLDDFLILQKMRDNLLNVNIGFFKFSAYLDTPYKETSIFWEGQGVKQKARLDLFYERNGQPNIIVDLKTTQSAIDFVWSVKNYKYYRQNAWYKDGLETIIKKPDTEFYFIACETVEPYGVKVYQLSENYIMLGRTENFIAIEKYKKWVENGSDKTIIYDNNIETIEKPAYL